MKALACIAGLLLFLNLGASASALCLSDSALKVVLINNQIEGLDALAGTCIAKQPNLAGQGAKALSAFHAAYSQIISRYKKLSVEIFEHAGLNAGAIDALREANQSASAKVADKYSQQECKNLLLGFEALAQAKNFKVIEKLALSEFKAKRESVPVCQ